jgi:sulfate adenylyltransferase (ADP) / ATP adenylyltransferase
MMKALDLPGPLHALVSKAFTAAKESESLIFSSTELAIIHTQQGVPVRLRSRHLAYYGSDIH